MSTFDFSAIQVKNRELMHDIKEKKEAPLGKEIENSPQVQRYVIY
jgi:hypothetical protein